MILKFSIILFLSCTFFAANVVGKDRKKGSSKDGVEEQNQDPYGNQNSYDQSGQYYDNGQQNPNQQPYDSYGQAGNNYGQNPYKRPGQKPISIGNGRGKTNVVSINGNEEPYIVGYSSSEGAFEYDQYGNRRDIPSYPQGSKGNGNNVIVVNERGREPDTVILSSQSRNGQKSTIVVNKNGVNLNPGASRNPYNSRGSYPQSNYGQSQDYGYY